MKANYNYKKNIWFSLLIIYSLMGIFLIFYLMKMNKNHALRYHLLSPSRLESIEHVDVPLLNIINQQFLLEN